MNDPTPEDIIPNRRSANYYRQMDQMVGQFITIEIPGQPIEGPDGELIGMTENRTERTYFGGAGVTPTELEQAGLTPADVPNLHIITRTPGRNTK